MPVKLWEFKNEPYADFSKPESAAAMRAALALVRCQLGTEYDLRIGGELSHRRPAEISQSFQTLRDRRPPSQGHRRTRQ